MPTFQLIRLVLSAVPAIGVFFLLRSRIHRCKLLWGIPIAIFVLLNIVLCEAPFENRFISFPTPQAAARYVGMSDAHCVVEGEQSGFFTSVDGNETPCRIFPKSDSGWQLSDTRASVFQPLDASGTAYAAYVPDYDGSAYTLFVDGQRIPLGE